MLRRSKEASFSFSLFPCLNLDRISPAVSIAAAAATVVDSVLQMEAKKGIKLATAEARRRWRSLDFFYRYETSISESKTHLLLVPICYNFNPSERHCLSICLSLWIDTSRKMQFAKSD